MHLCWGNRFRYFLLNWWTLVCCIRFNCCVVDFLSLSSSIWLSLSEISFKINFWRLQAQLRSHTWGARAFDAVLRPSKNIPCFANVFGWFLRSFYAVFIRINTQNQSIYDLRDQFTLHFSLNTALFKLPIDKLNKFSIKWPNYISIYCSFYHLDFVLFNWCLLSEKICTLRMFNFNSLLPIVVYIALFDFCCFPILASEFKSEINFFFDNIAHWHFFFSFRFRLLA